ncbi:phage major capsid protein [Cupriavidus oxalaticus]|nr:phage major capsid protein [Cupriavidus oxalaticus]
MSRSSEISTLERQRVIQLDTAEALHVKAKEESRVFTPTEQAEFDSAMRAVERIDIELAPLKQAEQLSGLRARAIEAPAYIPLFSPTAQNPTGQAITGKNGLPLGSGFTRYAMCLAAGKGNLNASLEYARNAYGQSNPELLTIIKAAVAAGTTSDPTWAAPLVAYRDMQAEFVELLRPATIIGRIQGFRRVPFNVRIPRQTAGASVGWVGEGAVKPVSRLSFDSITMPFSKMAGIIAITEELARFSSPSAEELVRRDLVATISQFMNIEFIDPSVAPDSTTNSPGSITYGAQELASSGSDMSAVSADLAAMLSAIVSNGFPLEGLCWVGNSRTKISLMNLRTSQDVYAYPSLALNGSLLGFPFIDSASVPLNASTPATTTLSLIAPGEILLADEGQTVLDASREAALSLSDDGATPLVSLWQSNLVAIRAERYVHWLRRRDGAVIVLTGVQY